MTWQGVLSESLGRLLLAEGWTEDTFTLLLATLKDGGLDKFDLETLEDEASFRRAVVRDTHQ